MGLHLKYVYTVIVVLESLLSPCIKKCTKNPIHCCYGYTVCFSVSVRKTYLFS